ncbi:thiamine-phosphate kinase [Bradyrhizobium sp. KB893862 SZCCT0404]|uniref:thiamine-phosphate kinase n=1 Tax=Bradyrhizobium sp. KB893862 SZCCT0404 TaxID=2807672 RepID=UPI001BA8AE5D|nr:thiamine-phosphate kinase [Bradyrhizobium sp. KB893862 SZCCT0404]MBR1173241.1 thiamine-phosphate kinase [Bradyrhizobium sp. KB893862 SZCCT0404]
MTVENGARQVADPQDHSGEDSLIARYFKPLATDPGALGLVDDAAVLASSGEDIVVTTDAVVEGVHYLATDPPDTIARKALRVNLSDLAAKGATPAGFVLTLALRSKEDSWLRPFADALGEDVRTFACPLLGGDTVSTPGPQMISITAFGRVPKGRMVGRTGARPGDRVFVTGTIGDAALGLDVLTGGATADVLKGDRIAQDHLLDRYRVPRPRNALAAAVLAHASAAMDVSDGLAGDLAKLCAASGVSASVEVHRVPLSQAAAAAVSAVGLEKLVSGGDDYEILCAVPEAHCDDFARGADQAGVPVTAIGTVVAGLQAPRWTDAQGREVVLNRLSYSHF